VVDRRLYCGSTLGIKQPPVAARLLNDSVPCRSAGLHWRRSDEKSIRSSEGCKFFHLMQLATFKCR
jgi:hypothetical protein